MDNRQGFTVEPLIYTDPSGQEHLSYDHANITDHSIHRDIYQDFEQNQEHFVHVDGQGNRQHDYDLGEEGALYDQNTNYELESDPEFYDDEDEYTATDEVFQILEENGISEDDLNDVIDWAEYGIDEHEQNMFNEIMESNDPDLIIRAIAALIEMWNESDEELEDDEESDYYYE